MTIIVRKDENILDYHKSFVSKIRRAAQDKKVRNMAIITDKDGTLFLNNQLRMTIAKLAKSNSNVRIFLIANTGRTIRRF